MQQRCGFPWVLLLLTVYQGALGFEEPRRGAPHSREVLKVSDNKENKAGVLQGREGGCF